MSDYLNPELPAEIRAADLLKQMTLEEKVGQMCQYVGIGTEALTGHAFREKTDEVDTGDNIAKYRDMTVQDLISLVERGLIGSFLSVYEPGEADMLQKIAARSRLGIPLLIGADAIHGHGMYRGPVTVFPAPLGLASAFDPGTAEAAARCTAREVRATGSHWVFSPNVDVVRDPRWGRNGETFGEDPLLVTRMGRAMIRGYQGEDLSAPDAVLGCAKHLAAGGAPENGLNFSPMEISERGLREIYFPSFIAAVQEGCATVMAAHNEINGIPCHGNYRLLTGILRDEWGFEGFIVSDWMDISRLCTLHRVAETVKDADRLAVQAGLDMHMHGPGFLEPLVELVREGKISEQRIDRSVKKILYYKFRLGLFENRYTSPETAEAVILCGKHRELALSAARKSIVLLKNESSGSGPILPLLSPGRIFVTGPNADNQTLLGDWTMKQPDENVVTVLQGIREAAPSGSEIDYLDTGDGFRIPEDILAEVTRRAAQAACCVAAVGGDSLRFSENRTCGENQGRSDIGLFGNQVELVKAAAAAGKPVIAVLINGRPLSVPWIKDNIPAIIEAWEPGMYGGRAIGEIIFGKVNPSGRLPVTIPRSAGHITQIYNHKPSAYFKQYVDGETDPLFEFGRGLSYTVFTYSNLTLPETIKTGEPADICIDVENTGKMAGDETVLVFLRDLYASVTTPVKKLAAFTRIHLKPGEKQTVHLTIPAEQMGLFNRDMEFVIEPGEFRVSVGGIEGVFRAV